MIISTFVCFIAGTTLAMRFKVAILLPVMFVVSAAILPFGILTGQNVLFIISLELSTLTALQLGYLSTIVIAARAVRKNDTPQVVTAHPPR